MLLYLLIYCLVQQHVY